ncbi:MAG: hypothetical protein INR65_17895, partial [Gluconacetobacter diazotrophicus]|nr:hypothetical protein [Gluconacetobacter diazotrophicus]
TVGQPVFFGSDKGRRYQYDGWQDGEAQWCWSQGGRPKLLFALQGPTPQTLRLRLMPYTHPPQLTRQRVKVLLNGHALGEFAPTEEKMQDYQLPLPVGVWQAHNTLAFDLPDATAPASVHDGQDLRVLGIALQSLELDGPEPAPTPAPTPASTPAPAPSPAP